MPSSFFQSFRRLLASFMLAGLHFQLPPTMYFPQCTKGPLIEAQERDMAANSGFFPFCAKTAA